MKIVNIKLGIWGAIIGIAMLILFNQNIQTLLGTVNNSELNILLSLAWISLCIVIAIIAPASITIGDSKENEEIQ